MGAFSASSHKEHIFWGMFISVGAPSLLTPSYAACQAATHFFAGEITPQNLSNRPIAPSGQSPMFRAVEGVFRRLNLPRDTRQMPHEKASQAGRTLTRTKCHST